MPHLYEGHFLADDADDPRIVAMRDNLCSKIVRTVCLIGERFEAEGSRSEAADLYTRGLELETSPENSTGG
ncbi:MAG TPA: hypothetical protein VGK44_02390 [Casimicrobiaceae bacterium]